MGEIHDCLLPLAISSSGLTRCRADRSDWGRRGPLATGGASPAAPGAPGAPLAAASGKAARLVGQNTSRGIALEIWPIASWLVEPNWGATGPPTSGVAPKTRDDRCPTPASRRTRGDRRNAACSWLARPRHDIARPLAAAPWHGRAVTSDVPRRLA
jgi:hypothetical protein